jgi:hypothetical protein
MLHRSLRHVDSRLSGAIIGAVSMTSLELVIARVGLKTKTPSADAVSMQSSNSTTMPLPGYARSVD